MKKSDFLLSTILGLACFAVIGAYCDALSSSESVGILGGVAVLALLPQLKKLINN